MVDNKTLTRSKCIVVSSLMLNLEKYLRTKSVLWRTSLPLLHISEQTAYCDAPHYHFSISQNKLCTVTHLITTSPHLRTNCVLWRTSLPLLHTSEQAVYCDAPHYHFSISQNKLCTVMHLITTSTYLRTNCVLWRTSLPLLHTSEQSVYCDAPHYHFSISQQQISRSSSSKYYKREKTIKAWMSIVDQHKRKGSKLSAAWSVLKCFVQISQII